MKFATKHGGDDSSRNDTGSCDADHHVWVVFARDFQCQRARELTEKWPLDVQNSLRGIDCLSAW